MKPLAEQSFYELLDVPNDASAERIEQAFEKASQFYGPESLATYTLADGQEAKQLLERIEEAYLTLSDPELRHAYDAEIGLGAPVSLPAADPSPATGPAPTPAPAAEAGQLAFAPILDQVRVFPWPGSCPEDGLDELNEPQPNTATPSPAVQAFVGAATCAPAPFASIPNDDGTVEDAELPPVRLATAGPSVADAAPTAPAAPEPEAVCQPAAPATPSPTLPEPQAAAPATAATTDDSARPASEASPADPEPVEPAPTQPIVAPQVEAPPQPAAAETLAAAPAEPAPAAPEAAPEEISADEVVEVVAAATILPSAPVPAQLEMSEPPAATAAAAAAEVAIIVRPGVAPAVAHSAAEPARPAPEPVVEPSAPKVEEPKPAARALPRMPDLPPNAVFNGELLRRVREGRGITARELADRTKIGLTHIENIEADRYDALPVPVYLRGFLMLVARELKLDPLKVSKSFLEQVARHGGKKSG